MMPNTSPGQVDEAALLRRLAYPKEQVDVVLDTDAYNESDDQYALAYLLLNPQRANVQAIYAAPFTNPKATVSA